MQRCTIPKVMRYLDLVVTVTLVQLKTYPESRILSVVRLLRHHKKRKMNCERWSTSNILAISKLWTHSCSNNNNLNRNQNDKVNLFNGLSRTKKRSSNFLMVENLNLTNWWKTLTTLKTLRCNCKNRIFKKNSEWRRKRWCMNESIN